MLDVASTDYGATVAGAAGPDKSSAQRGGSGQVAEFSSLESFAFPSDPAACDSLAAVTFGQEDMGVLVSRAGQDVAVLETTHSQPQSGLQLPSAAAQEVTSHSPQQCVEKFLTTSVQQPSEETSHPPSSSTAIDSATPSDLSGTTTVEPAQQPGPTTTEPPTKTRKPRRKKALRDPTQEPTRQRLPRAAANEEKL